MKSKLFAATTLAAIAELLVSHKLSAIYSPVGHLMFLLGLVVLGYAGASVAELTIKILDEKFLREQHLHQIREIPGVEMQLTDYLEHHFREAVSILDDEDPTRLELEFMFQYYISGHQKVADALDAKTAEEYLTKIYLLYPKFYIDNNPQKTLENLWQFCRVELTGLERDTIIMFHMRLIELWNQRKQQQRRPI